MTHGSPELDADAEKLLALGVDPGPTLADLDLEPPALSPFLPCTNIQFAWDSTCLGLLKTCPRLYQYTMIDGWSSRDQSIHLRFGIEYHTALQQYEVSRANGVSHEDSIHTTVKETMVRTADWHPDTSTKAGKYKNRECLVRLVVDYLDHYGPNDPAQTYIKADGQPAVELSFRFELEYGPKTLDEFNLEVHDPGQPYLLCGHLDRVVTFNDALLVLDHKTTTTTLGSYYFDQWEPNNQMTLYTLAGRVVLSVPIRGIVISAAQILLEEPNRFVRGFTYRTPDQLDEWMQDLSTLLRINETYATANHWPMNDTACDKFGGCKFRGICSKSPSVREKFLRADFIKLPEAERWNPLRSR